jgi:outer membrane protein TolC
VALVLAGCAGSSGSDRYAELTGEYRQATIPPETPAGPAPDTLFVSADTLGRRSLIEAVLLRNPDLEAIRNTWGAALARYPQARSLADPLLRYELAPGSIGSDKVSFGQLVQIRQDFPFPGKLGLRGDAALAEAEAAQGDYETARVRLAAMTSGLYDEYYLLDRELAINREHLSLMEEYRRSAAIRYGSGSSAQTEPLRAEVVSAHLAHRRIELSSDREVTMARINTLLHRPVDAPLPPPPVELDIPPLGLTSTDTSGVVTAGSHPELRSAAARIRAAQATLDLADRNAYPDLGVLASYNSMWAQPEHQWMVGVVLNLPLWGGVRDGEREEARARLGEAEAASTSLSDDVAFRVHRAGERVEEAFHIVQLYRDRLLPATRDEVTAIRASFETGRVPFLELIDAERELRDVELEYEKAVVDYYRSRADLAEARGEPAFLEEEVSR